MSEQDPGLTEADRKAIAEIRRELDAEFGPLEDAVPLHVRQATDTPDVRLMETEPHAWSSRPGVIAAFVAGLLLGAIAGSVGTLTWLLHTENTAARATSSPAAPGATPPPPAPAGDPTAAPADGATPAPAGDPARTSLRNALDEWLDATRRGDVPAQMRFYPSRVPVYYTWRDVPRDAVRAEKRKVFDAATVLQIDTGAPAIDLGRDGATATTSFRKRYVIEGPAVQRRGEVLQELRWERTDTGWVIVSERDARVLAP